MPTIDWSVVLVFLPVFLLTLVAIRLATLRQGWSPGRALAGLAAGALLSSIPSALVAGGSAAAWQNGLLAALLGFTAGALAVPAAVRWQRRALR
ncbi:MAG: hypothetical protein RMK01_09020 [Thermomicrobium sp.]|nr:hypothetical protein [Thermomicrobium sp.]MDW8060202.1 hypothetical protein [Thermomicrobium sp.]